MWKWLFSSKEPTEEDALGVLDYFRYTSDVDFFMKSLKSAVEKWPGIQTTFLKQFASGQVLEATVEMIKAMMIEWPEELKPVMAGLLKAENVVAAMAMGSEKSKFNKSYYALVRDEMKMQSEEFRKHLVGIRKGWDVVSKTFPSTKQYSLCLFNEPFVFNITNIPCNQDLPIITMYKENVEKHEYLYDPTNLPLDTPLTQKNVYEFQKHASKEHPIVIVAGNVDENVYVPENVWIVFTNSTKSWGERIVPFFNEKGHSVLKNMMDFMDTL